MNTQKRTGRRPALIMALLTTGVAATALILTTGGGSTAAAAHQPRPVAASGHAHRAAHPTRSTRITAQLAARATTSDSEGPRPGDSPAQMYLTDSASRRDDLIHTYDKCLITNGAEQTSTQPGPVPSQGAHTPLAIEQPVPASASRACKDVQPLLPKEQNPNLNGDYAADSKANIACLRSHGVMVHQVPDRSVWPDGLGWTYDSSTTPTPDDQAQIEHDCTTASFASGNW